MTMPGAGGDDRRPSPYDDFDEELGQGRYFGPVTSKEQKWREAEVRRWKFRAFLTRGIGILLKILLICFLGSIIWAVVLLRVYGPH
jgi:hypothetical protein